MRKQAKVLLCLLLLLALALAQRGRAPSHAKHHPSP